ncbi:hypothetical protein [Pseudonocardia oroxyli]|uniref:Uncharacterized protein n=1 Tax=Pseudonocardia oroxyli TaxID=366584 RepID=A0A1G7VX03_PSEOR|nr:hypothetical protein [Pseudonocardia oroxyli]SDG63410.1 hypothetical protein SAMN05216377_113191 [Pseudonocardia oroxyli]
MDWIVLVVGGGVVALVSVGITVGLMEARQRAVWRMIAAERRRRWDDDRPSDDEG